MTSKDEVTGNDGKSGRVRGIPDDPIPAPQAVVAPSTPAKRATKKVAAATSPPTESAPVVHTPAHAASADTRHSLLSSDSDDADEGMPPRYDDGSTWLRAGLQRHPAAVITGLVLGWSGIWIAFWGAMGGAIIGVLIGAGLTSRTLPFFNSFGAGQTVSLVSAAAGFFVGALGGLIAVVIYIVMHPITLFGSLVAGTFVSLVVVTTSASCERLSLRVRGYRRLSRDEVRRVAPLVKDVADAMELPALPRFAMADQVIPNAWSHMRTIVITTGMLQALDDGELRAILVHELTHWRKGDTVGLRVVWAAAWPVVLIYNLGTIISGWSPKKRLQTSGNTQGLFRWLVAWLIAWPAWVMTKVILVPLLATSQRRYEYEADAAAYQLGLGTELSSALRKIGAFETGRTGWEAAMSATHPPTELRLEALQTPQADDWEYQEEELHGPTVREFFRMLKLGFGK